MHALNPQCFYCHEVTELSAHEERHELTATVDHFIPRKFGGPDKPRNFRLACWDCNQLKNDALPLHIGKDAEKRWTTNRRAKHIPAPPKS